MIYYLRQKPAIEELCKLFSAVGLRPIYCASKALFQAFSCETALRTATKAHNIKYNWAAACSRGILDVIIFLHNHEREGTRVDHHFREYEAGWAAESGHLEVVKWLYVHRKHYPKISSTNRTMDLAASGGHLDTVRWLHENCERGCSTNAMDLAASNNHLHVLQWLHSNRREGCTSLAICYAAMNGHLAVVQWLHANCAVELNQKDYWLSLAARWAGHHNRSNIVEWTKQEKQKK